MFSFVKMHVCVCVRGCSVLFICMNEYFHFLKCLHTFFFYIQVYMYRKMDMNVSNDFILDRIFFSINIVLALQKIKFLFHVYTVVNHSATFFCIQSRIFVICKHRKFELWLQAK